MSTHSFRDSIIVILDTGRTTIRAGLGLHDLLRTPTVEIPARVGLRKASTLNGEQNGGSKFNGSYEPQPSTSTSKRVANPATRVKEYLVGAQLEEAIASGQDVEVYWPFAEGDVSDWTQAEALWKYVLFNQLQLRRAQMESPVLLSIACGLSRDAYERICLMFFERFNVAGFGILDRPMAQFYATVTNPQLCGLVVDIGYDFTDITPIYEGFVIHNARTTVNLGANDCTLYLAHLLRSNSSVMSALSPAENPLSPVALQETLVALAKRVYDDGLIKVLAEGEAARDLEEEGVTDIAAVLVAGKEKAVIEAGTKKKATAKASAAEQARAREIEALDLVTVQFGEHALTLGKERHRFCEPLFDPSLMLSVSGARVKGVPDERLLPLHVAVGHAMGKTDVDCRQYIWQGLFVTGEITNRIRGVGAALQDRLSPFILGNQDQSLNDVQPKAIRILRIPDYFAEYREKGDGLASFLGASIAAKITFNEAAGRNFVSKSDYAERGPRTVLEMSPSLL